MRRIIITIAFLTVVILSYGQSVPQFESNFKTKDKVLIQKQFQSDFDFVLVYSESSFWYKYQDFYAVVLADSAYKAVTWRAKSSKVDANRKYKKKKLAIPSDQLAALIQYFTNQGFWQLENELLNKSSKPLNDSTNISIQIMDGASYKFISSTKSITRTTYASNPDMLNEKIPLPERDSFIACRTKFVEIVIKKKTVANKH